MYIFFDRLGYRCLTIFQLCLGGQFYSWRKPVYLEKTNYIFVLVARI